MIKTPTVFILGAGASIPYGYPSGDTLRQQICYELENPTHPYTREILNHGFSKKEIIEFRNSFFYSAKPSIDAFLEHRTEFIEIGKLVIARSLIPHEDLNSLFDTKNGKWYSYFYNRLNTSFDEFDKNEFSVITFNYDRSFEQFLFTALKNSYNKKDNECASKLEKIPIIHVHGKLDDLDWQNPKGRPYDGNSDSFYSGKFLKRSAEGIKIIHEEIDDSKSFKDAHKLLDCSENIYFFGFGYNKTNLERLNISDYLGKSIKGIAYGLAKAEQDYVHKLFNNSINLHNNSSWSTLNYLRTNFNFE